MKRQSLAVLMALALAACAPSDGPKTQTVLSKSRKADVPILQINDEVVAKLGDRQLGGDLSTLGRQNHLPGVIKPGDTISVTLFDTGESGMFNAAESGAVTLGEFPVSSTGAVNLPFVGTVQIGGRSTAGAQNLITQTLRENAINPSTTVSISRKATDNYTVQGAVGAAGVYGLTPGGESVLDGIATAGGARTAPDQTVVTLLRGSHQASQRLDELIANPRSDIPLLPNDTVVVGLGDASYFAEGALLNTGEFPFAEGAVTLAKAVAKAGGLQASRANPRSVFVMRRMKPGESFMLRDWQGNQRVVTGDVIFRADYKDPQQILNASKFQMRDGDVLYVGNAPLANFSKYFQIFNSPPEVPAPQAPLVLE
ncbi:polysaccharide biosynthesis/export family protein [Ruegeria jejuensis]|uniref:polysaccharide biosynthesis/export family protein n=1 Tax=Ruegeria jejuensis TaxID=3233338 RepID=UPI00355C53D7